MRLTWGLFCRLPRRAAIAVRADEERGVQPCRCLDSWLVLLNDVLYNVRMVDNDVNLMRPKTARCNASVPSFPGFTLVRLAVSDGSSFRKLAHGGPGSSPRLRARSRHPMTGRPPHASGTTITAGEELLRQDGSKNAVHRSAPQPPEMVFSSYQKHKAPPPAIGPTSREHWRAKTPQG